MGTDANERVSTKYKYDLAPVVEQQQTVQLVGGVTHTHIAESTYDHADRLLGVKETVKIGSTSKSAYTLAQRYNTLGQLQTKWLHGNSDNSLAYRTRTNYKHNILGWLAEAKTWYQKYLGSDRPFYTLNLSYENKQNADKYSNGNITKMEWAGKTLTSNANGLAFSYDDANRLLSALKPQGVSYTYNDTESGITYYKNGNIHTLKRSGAASDDMTYTYLGNKLTSVSDASTSSTGVKYGTSPYSYDASGNMTSDGNRAATLTYNYLNLPKTITIGSKVSTYDYDAAGTKYKYVSDTLTVKYAGIFEYNANNAFKRVATTTGQAILTNAGTLSFNYYIKDHLGNVRVVFDEIGNVLQQTDYYPFGLEIDRNSPLATTDALKAARNGTNRYLYNGKELQVGTGYLDYGARMYMPELGRFGTVDRFSEKYHPLSAFQYGANNPIRNIDVNGDSIVVSSSLREDKTAWGAWQTFANTRQGRKFLANFASAGQNVGKYQFTTNGKYHAKGIIYRTAVGMHRKTRKEQPIRI